MNVRGAIQRYVMLYNVYVWSEFMRKVPRHIPMSSSEEAPSSLRGTLFHDDNEIKQATESYLDSMPQEFYLTGIKELFDRCNKYIAVKDDYVKNKTKIFFVPFVRHIELQNFLIAPRRSAVESNRRESVTEYRATSIRHQ